MLLKPSCYHDGHSHMGSGVLWKIIVIQHSMPLHQEMQLEIVLSKEEGIHSFCTETMPTSLGPKSSEMEQKNESVNVFSGQTSPYFSLFFRKTDFGFYEPKMKKTIQTVTNEKCKNEPL